MHLAEDLRHFRLSDLSLRTPGYPILLVLTGASQHATAALFYVQLGLHFIAVWLLASMLSGLGLSHRPLLLFGVLLILPPYVEASGYVLPENLTEFGLAVGLFSLCSWISTNRVVFLWMSSGALAYTALTRPTFQAAAVAITACLWVCTRLLRLDGFRHLNLLRAGTVLVLVSAAVMGSYSVLNYVKFGYFESPILSLSLTTRTIRFVERLPDRYAVMRDALIRSRNADLITGSSHTGYQSVGRVLEEMHRTSGLPEAEIAQDLVKANLVLIAKAPLSYLLEVADAVSAYWFPWTQGLANSNTRFVQFLWSVLHFVVIFIFGVQLFALGGTQLFGLSKGLMARSPAETPSILVTTPHQVFAYCLALTLVVYTMVISCFLNVGIPRYRVPTDPIIILLLFLGVQIWTNSVRHVPAGDRQVAGNGTSDRDANPAIK